MQSKIIRVLRKINCKFIFKFIIIKKSLLLLLLLFIGVAFGQKKKSIVKKFSQIEIAQQKGKKYFEENVVKNFKDPYSYELKKIWTEENTIYRNNIRMIGELESLKTIKSAKKRQDSIMDVTAAMSDDEKHKIQSYIVNIDAHGANSYGNKILGRYKIEVSPEGEILGHTKE